MLNRYRGGIFVIPLSFFKMPLASRENISRGDPAVQLEIGSVHGQNLLVLVLVAQGACHFDAFLHRLVITVETQLGDLEGKAVWARAT